MKNVYQFYLICVIILITIVVNIKRAALIMIISIKKVLRVLKSNNIEFELTTENELFTTIKLKDLNKPKTIHVATLERG